MRFSFSRKASAPLDEALVRAVQDFLDQYLPPELPVLAQSMAAKGMAAPSVAAPPRRKAKVESIQADSAPQFLSEANAAVDPELDRLLGQLDESFQQMLLRKIDERGITDTVCYKRAGLDRKLFSKIRKDPQYRPSKSTAVALALALELSLDETKELLSKAGFALSHASKFDLIVEYLISQGCYDRMIVNEVLYRFDQPLLGA